MSTVVEAQLAVLPGGVLDNGPLYLIIKNQNISAIQNERPAEAHDHFIQAHLITPGFIDIHTHGLGIYVHSSYLKILLMILLQVEQMKLQNFGSIPVCMHIKLEISH